MTVHVSCLTEKTTVTGPQCVLPPLTHTTVATAPPPPTITLPPPLHISPHTITPHTSHLVTPHTCHHTTMPTTAHAVALTPRPRVATATPLAERYTLKVIIMRRPLSLSLMYMICTMYTVFSKYPK